MKTRELRLPLVVSSFNATRIMGTFATLGSRVYRVAAALAGLVSSVAISACGDDCGPLRTAEGERLKVTIVSKQHVCSEVPLAKGDEFLIDLRTTYRDDTAENCLERLGRVSRLPAAFSDALTCSEGRGFGTWVVCGGVFQDSQCGVRATVSFPPPPEVGKTTSTGTVEVWWSTSCWHDNCYGDLRDAYDATIERVGMGWVPPAE